MFRKILLLLVMMVGVGAASAQDIVPCSCILSPEVSVDYHRVNVDVDNMIATTTVEMQFTNRGEGLAEGQFLFPLPAGAAVQQLTMFVNGVAIEAKILPADEARATYDAIVRQMRDPALLEYVGRDLLQASVFPIPAGEARQIKIVYGQALEVENGLVKVSYPLKTPVTSNQIVAQTSVRVSVQSASAIGNVYSPSHRISLSRPDDTSFVASFEQSDASADSDFVLYYGVQSDKVSVNLLSYRESSDQDGFFMLMIQPPMTEPENIQAKDVVIVLDQSGSMDGTKWEQAQDAAAYVLENLNTNDRFNVIPFSSSYRTYADTLLAKSEAAEAVSWVRGLYPEGGTNISDALGRALDFADAERPLTIIFLTDGLATEGIVDTPSLLDSLGQKASPNVRLFTFGVGDDVDTVLLDTLVRDFRGTGSYVRPGERIDEEVAALYTKISSPVLNDVTLSIEGATTELLYPQTLSDLFAGEQITLVGRYRNGSSDATVTLTGKQNGQTQTLTYSNLTFNDRAGGSEFIARLWATRRIGDLLNQIRLNGENRELVDSVVSLSVRYGIITPYTSFLITEDDVLSQAGREDAQNTFANEARELAGAMTGSGAVDAADASSNLANAQAPAPAATQSSTVLKQETLPDGSVSPSQEPIRYAGDKTFLLQGDVWTDTTYDPDSMTPRQVTFASDEYFELLTQHPEIAPYLAVADHIILVLDGAAIEIVP